MQYEWMWIDNVAKISPDYTFIRFFFYFNKKIKPNTLPKNLTNLIFGNNYNQKIKPNTLPEKLTTLIFGDAFNQKIGSNTLPENLTTLTFGFSFNQKIELNTLPEKLTTLNFGHEFNQKIEPNTLPETLTTLTFGYYFNQNLDLKILPSNLKYIEFNWKYLNKQKIPSYIEMVNNIFGNYDVKIFLSENILDDNGPKWPIHVYNYTKKQWSSEIYEVIGKYRLNIYDITILINKETFQPYSHAKSALK